MISEDGWGLSFPYIRLTVEKPRKKQPEKLIRPRIEFGPARREVTMLPLDHSDSPEKKILFSETIILQMYTKKCQYKRKFDKA